MYSCALDVTDQHPDGLTMEQVGNLLNISYEMVRKVEASAIKKAKRRMLEGWRGMGEDGDPRGDLGAVFDSQDHGWK
jgi:hypothetical protein